MNSKRIEVRGIRNGDIGAEDDGIYSAKRICDRQRLTADNVAAVTVHRKRIDRAREFKG